MKNFDLENLERKNPYKVPDDFFSAMQENVLKATVEHTPLTVSPVSSGKKNWWYAVAASFTILLGSVFFLNRESGAANIAQNTVDAQHEVLPVKSTPVNSPETQEAASNYHTFVSDLTSVEKQNQTLTELKTVATVDPVAAKTKKEVRENTEVPVEQILEGFSEEELALLAKNTEQDIYLDLYN